MTLLKPGIPILFIARRPPSVTEYLGAVVSTAASCS